MLPPVEFDHEILEYEEGEFAFQFYKMLSRMDDTLHILTQQSDVDVNFVHIAAPRILPIQIPSMQLDQDNLLEYEIAPIAVSDFIFILRSLCDWQAQVFIPFGLLAAQISLDNNVLQG